MGQGQNGQVLEVTHAKRNGGHGLEVKVQLLQSRQREDHRWDASVLLLVCRDRRVKVTVEVKNQSVKGLSATAGEPV